MSKVVDKKRVGTKAQKPIDLTSPGALDTVNRQVTSVEQLQPDDADFKRAEQVVAFLLDEDSRENPTTRYAKRSFVDKLGEEARDQVQNASELVNTKFSKIRGYASKETNPVIASMIKLDVVSNEFFPSAGIGPDGPLRKLFIALRMASPKVHKYLLKYERGKTVIKEILAAQEMSRQVMANDLEEFEVRQAQLLTSLYQLKASLREILAAKALIEQRIESEQDQEYREYIQIYIYQPMLTVARTLVQIMQSKEESYFIGETLITGNRHLLNESRLTTILTVDGLQDAMMNMVGLQHQKNVIGMIRDTRATLDKIRRFNADMTERNIDEMMKLDVESIEQMATAVETLTRLKDSIAKFKQHQLAILPKLDEAVKRHTALVEETLGEISDREK
ncbi:hypothetical protein COT97_03340, partial [Candidatus Falkowbacteria bacterium CG10_big_fil_rev_8_21_14_0_10_39_11]